MLRLALIFVILIVYGSLFPFAVWRMPPAPLFSFLLQWPAGLSRADVVQNVLAYAPFGLFLTAAQWQPGAPKPLTVAWRSGAAAFMLSLSMECLQQFEPARNASTADIVMNVIGCLGGAGLATLLLAEYGGPSPRSPLARLHGARARLLQRGVLANLGLAAVALWVLAQTSPLLPAFDAAYLARKLGRLRWQLIHPLSISVPHMAVAFAQQASLGLLLCCLVRAPQREGRASLLTLFSVMLGAVYTLKLLVYGRQPLVEELLGAGAAVLLLLAARHRSARTLAASGAALLLGGFIADELTPGGGAIAWQFNWVPLRGQMRSLAGMENILELFWPFFTLAVFARMLTPARREAVCWLGAPLVLALVFELEWMQQSVPGRYGDITQVMLALCGWLLPWSFRSADFSEPPRAPLAVPAAASAAAAAHADSSACQK